MIHDDVRYYLVNPGISPPPINSPPPPPPQAYYATGSVSPPSIPQTVNRVVGVGGGGE
jgi:hypothetical protein